MEPNSEERDLFIVEHGETLSQLFVKQIHPVPDLTAAQRVLFQACV